MKANILLLGPTGTGKNYACRTLNPYFERIFWVSLEQGLTNVIFKDPLPPGFKEKNHYKYIPVATTPWDVLQSNAKMLNMLSPADLQKMRPRNPEKYQQFVQVYATLANFTCDCHNVPFGPVDDFDDKDVLILDSWTALSQMSRDLVTGGKPIITQPEWGIAMDNLYSFLTKWCGDLKCSTIILGHIERETDQMTGGTRLMISTLGAKLAPKLPRLFDEVILTKRIGDRFTWSTADVDVDLKTRLLPIKDGLEPDFGLIFKGRV
jgi:AAA domain-containing protein